MFLFKFKRLSDGGKGVKRETHYDLSAVLDQVELGSPTMLKKG